MNRKLVLLLTAIFLAGTVGIDIPAQAVPGPFGYDLQKDLHRSQNKNAQQQEQDSNTNSDTEQSKVPPVNKNVTDDDIFDSSVNFNKVYYPNASMKSAVTKYKKGNYTGCLQELYTLVKKNPKNAMAYYYVALAYTKVGCKQQADNAYQKVIALNSNPVMVDYATRGRNCLAGNVACGASNIKIGEGEQKLDDLDKFIAAPYGNGMSPEMNKQYKQQQLDAIQNKINNGQTLSPQDIQKMKELQNDKSEAIFEDKLAMADNNTMPSNEEVLGALDVLKRAGLNISTNSESSTAQPAYTPDPQIQQMSMMLNGNNNNNNDPFMSMLPYMMEGEGKNVNPQLIQTMMVNSMMNSINGMNMSNNN